MPYHPHQRKQLACLRQQVKSLLGLSVYGNSNTDLERHLCLVTRRLLWQCTEEQQRLALLGSVLPWWLDLAVVERTWADPGLAGPQRDLCLPKPYRQKHRGCDKFGKLHYQGIMAKCKEDHPSWTYKQRLSHFKRTIWRMWSALTSEEQESFLPALPMVVAAVPLDDDDLLQDVAEALLEAPPPLPPPLALPPLVAVAEGRAISRRSRRNLCLLGEGLLQTTQSLMAGSVGRRRSLPIHKSFCCSQACFRPDSTPVQQDHSRQLSLGKPLGFQSRQALRKQDHQHGCLEGSIRSELGSFICLVA